MASAPYLRIIETTKISPPPSSVPETSIPLTFFDVIWLDLPPVERLFFYPYHDSTSQFISSTLPALKSSLSIALQSFFPLAGNIRPLPGTTEKHEIHYTEGDSVSFVAAALDDHLELFGDGPREISKLKILVPQLSKNQSEDLRPVLALQVTVFPHRGVVIGITVHHSVCDGNGSVNFMRTWATICHSSNSLTTDVPEAPILDRSVVPDPGGSLYETIAKSVLGFRDLEVVMPVSPEVPYYASFALNHDHVRFLKEKFMHEAEKRKVAVRCSTVIVTYAFIWIGHIKAKPTGLKNEEAHCVFAVDHRKWFQPAIPENYFGNCIAWCCAKANVRDLVGPNGFFEACQVISRAFETAKQVGINDAKDWVRNALDRVDYNPISASGSVRFRVYDVDFGWGKPEKVDIVSIQYSGAMAVAPSKEQGRVEIGLPLTQREMEVFKNYFDESLQEMSALSN